MHGIEHCIQERRTLRQSAPRLPFLRQPLQRFLTRRSRFLNGTGCSQRPFARLQRFPLSRAPFQGQRSRPVASLPCERLPLSVRLFGSATRIRFAPDRAASTPEARYSIHCPLRPQRLRPPLPLGTFTSHQIKVFSQICYEPARLPNPPDFLSLPAAYCLKVFSYGSSFLDRYVSGGLLFQIGRAHV